MTHPMEIDDLEMEVVRLRQDLEFSRCLVSAQKAALDECRRRMFNAIEMQTLKSAIEQVEFARANGTGEVLMEEVDHLVAAVRAVVGNSKDA